MACEEQANYTPQAICSVRGQMGVVDGPDRAGKPVHIFVMNLVQDKKLMLLIVLIVCMVSLGCVRRRMTIRSNPPGAMVYIDDQQIGQTPVSTGFTYYGTRTVTLVRDGYETTTVKHTFESPWYQRPPLDFFSENFTVREIRDERVLDFTLVPQQMIPSEQLWHNAENLRQSAQQGYVAPLPDSGRGNAPLMTPEAIPAPPPTLNAPLPMTGDTGHRGPWR